MNPIKYINIFCVIAFVFWMSKSNAQDYQITFSILGDIEYPDSVLVENIDQNTSLLLNGNDILYLFQNSTGIISSIESEEYIKVFPNPVKELATIEFYNINSEQVTISVYDVYGKKIGTATEYLVSGYYTFNIIGFQKGANLVKISSNNTNYSAVIISTLNSNSSTSIEMNAAPYSEGNTSLLKSACNISETIDMQYNDGELLHFTAYLFSTNSIEEIIPTESQTISFDFSLYYPVTDFSVNRTEVPLDSLVHFTDNSSNDPISWNWDFGDGNYNIIDQNPFHSYTSPGRYSVKLTASNEFGSNTISKTDLVQVIDFSPNSDFTVDKQVISVDSVVSFFDSSEKVPTSWYWNFGDGTTSSEQNPIHSYDTVGLYTISLTTSNIYGENTIIKPDYIEVEDDNDGDGFTESQGDCDDNNSLINPDATEICCDDIDQNCDGLGCPIDYTLLIDLPDSIPVSCSKEYTTGEKHHTIVLIDNKGKRHEWNDELPDSIQTKDMESVEIVGFVKTSWITECTLNAYDLFTGKYLGLVKVYKERLTIDFYLANSAYLLEKKYFYADDNLFCDFSSINVNSSLIDISDGILGNQIEFNTAISSYINNFIHDSTILNPKILTGNPDSVTASSVQIKTNISKTGPYPILSKGVCWSTYSSPTLNDNYIIEESNGLEFKSIISDLIENTTYYIRSYATNKNGTFYGNEKIFKTRDGVPVISLRLSDILANSVIIHGEITDDGGTDIITNGICWSETEAPTVFDNILIQDPGGIIKDTLENLIENTEYHMRLFVINEIDTFYSYEKKFIARDMSGILIDSQDNNEYKWVIIGNQTWMAENLAATKLNDGSEIKYIESGSNWVNKSNSSKPAYCYYHNDTIDNKEKYGALYNYATVQTGKVCPAGWHVPTVDDWWILVEYLEEVHGPFAFSTPMFNPNEDYGTWEGMAPYLKSADGWNGIDEYGFNGLPAGERWYTSGQFQGEGTLGAWWCIATYSAMSYLSGDNFEIYSADKTKGQSIRCIKD
jgi:uncharacterized protein (TIGR02145 family)